jgi:hypothetical protein
MNSTVAFATDWLIGLPVVNCAATNVVVGCPVVVVRRWLGMCICLNLFEFPPSLILSFFPPHHHKFLVHHPLFLVCAPPRRHAAV